MNTVALSLRDMLWLLASLLMVSAPHVERLPLWVTALAVVLLAWRLHLARGRLPLPRKWLLLCIVAAASAGIYIQYRTLFGRDAGVTLLILMLALKTLETHSQRDGILLIFLGYFIVITNFLYSQTITTALYMLLCVWVITATMIGLHYTRPQSAYLHRLRTAALLLAQSAPLMLVLFLFFPRVTGPLWGLPQDAFSGVSGMSETMSPGTIINLSLSDAVAFRVEFKSPVPAQRNLYWRGPVMWNFNGRTWTARPYLYYFGELRFETNSLPVDYNLTLEPHNDRWLFALDLPDTVPPTAVSTRDFHLRSRAPVTGRIRYPMKSYLEYRMGLDEPPEMRQRALQLPPGANPRAAQFARNLRGKYTDDKALMNEVLAMFRSEQFFYTLEPPPLGEHAVDEFLFDTRKGFCEHYASAFAVLMRAAGIPARVVTGYLGGEFNPLGNYMIVRQADAHAWTEVWFAGEGWVRVDPTAAVSPLRIESGAAAAVPQTGPLPMFARGGYAWIKQLRFSWDALANNWNQWVLGYNPQRQRTLLLRAGIDDATWRTLAVILIVATGLITLVLALLMLRNMQRVERDPALLAYRRFCAKLESKGLPRNPAEGPMDYASRLASLRPDLAVGTATITRLYVALRYGSDAVPGAVQALEWQVRKFQA
jgi:transglutaminase-like putative cysteine protease